MTRRVKPILFANYIITLDNDESLSPTVYYSTLKEGSMVRNVYTKKEVCFVAQLKKGTMFTRWIGTIGTQKGQKSCVFISLPTGNNRI